MIKVILDGAVHEELQSLRACVELCDADGKTVGYFTPASTSGPEPFEPKVSEAELDRREAETETFSTAAVNAFLKDL